MEPLTPQQVGRRIEIVRTAADLTGQELGERLGKKGENAAGYVSQLENGRRVAAPNQDVLMSIATHCAISGDLIGTDVNEVASFLIGLTDKLCLDLELSQRLGDQQPHGVYTKKGAPKKEAPDGPSKSATSGSSRSRGYMS